MTDAPANMLADEVVRLIPPLRAYARGLTRNPDDAEDLVQETLVKAIANVTKFKPGTNLRAWLFTIMRNTFYTNSRKRTRERPADEDCASTQPVIYPRNETQIDTQRIIATISRLPDHYREIVFLVMVMGESYEDAAAICDVAIGTVKSRLNRARRIVMDDIGAKSLHQIL